MSPGLVISKVLLVSVRSRAQTGGQGWSVIFLWQQFCDTEPHYTNTRGQHTIQGRSRVREMVLFIVTLCSDQPRSDYCESDRKSRQGENMCNKASYSVIAGGTRLLFIRFIKLKVQVGIWVIYCSKLIFLLYKTHEECLSSRNFL